MDHIHHFSTAGEAAARRAARFSEQMERLFAVGLAVSAPEARPFDTQMTAYCGRHLRFAALRFSPHETFSSRRTPEGSRLLVTLQKEGSAVVRQEGRETRVEAGDLVLIDPSRPFSIETGDILTHSVYLERDPLRSVLPELDHLTARAVHAHEGAAALFRGLVDEMFRGAGTLQEDAANRIADALPHVLGAALSGIGAADRALPSRLKRLHKERILRYARENLRDHRMNARSVAEAVELSTRYVYELFEDEPQPLMKWVWTQRLERCRADLAAPALRTRTIGEIAYQWGFNDLAHFSRAFRQRYGMSPRQFRARPGTEPA